MNNLHGTYSIKKDADIVRYELIGTFNENVTQDFIDELKSLILGYSSRPFKLMNVQIQLEGATPAAFELVNQLNEWLNTQNMIAKAIVNNSEVLAKMHRFFIPAREAQNIQYFSREEDALAWLTSQN